MRKADLIKNHNEFEEDLHWYIDFIYRMLVAERVVKYDDKIEILESLRNYLSHYSGKSRRQLHKMYQDSWQLRKFREPGDFLMAYSGKRLVRYIQTFLDASEQMRVII